MLVVREHEQVKRLLECRDFLMRRLARPQLIHLAVVLLVVDGARAVRGAV